VVICLVRGADLHIAQLMPLPLTVSCSSKIQIGFNFLVPAYLGSPGKSAVKRVCVCVCVKRCSRAGMHQNGIPVNILAPERRFGKKVSSRPESLYNTDLHSMLTI